MAKYNIGGYIFNDENSARKAAKELKAVEYILGQIKASDENGVLQVYKKLLDQRLFSTEIGMSFLSQLRQNLVNSGAFSEDDIPPVYDLEISEPDGVTEVKETPVIADKKEVKEESSVDIPNKKAKPSKEQSKKSKKAVRTIEVDEGEIKRLRRINRFLMVCVVTLLLCVGGMFYVSSTIDSPTILNYKETITDEFSTWKQELDEREKALDAREAKLNEREFGVSDIE